MNKVFIIILLTILSLSSSFASEIKIIGNNIDNKIIINKVVLNKEVSRTQIFKFFSDFYNKNIPSSYKYIKLNFTDLRKSDEIYSYLQKLVYLDLINNSNTRFNKDKPLNAYSFYILSKNILKLDNIKLNELINLKEKDTGLTYNQILQKKDTKKDDLKNIKTYFLKKLVKFNNITSDNKKLIQEKLIFENVYNTLITSYYDSANINRIKLIQSAIEGLTKGVGDKFSVYFPPIETKDFYDSLNGEYEGIGSYVDMIIPGVLKILSPISGSPSEKAGLKGGDLIIKVDDKEIKRDNSLKEVISWIKGPAGTKVILTIRRGNKIFDIEVERAKINIKDVEYKSLNSKTYLIKITSFGDKVSSRFKEAILDLKKHTMTKKIIIDLRNNGGGYLGQVSDMLSYFVPKDEQTALVKYKSGTKGYKSVGYSDIDFSKYKIILLENSATASASEIMIGTIKDYFPEATIIGENSYGKGSVQTLKSYIDGSSLKYTIAKWFTGKKEIGIDGIGIKPDIKVVFNIDKFKKNGYDNQLEKAKNIR